VKPLSHKSTAQTARDCAAVPTSPRPTALGATAVVVGHPYASFDGPHSADERVVTGVKLNLKVGSAGRDSRRSCS